MSKHTPGPWKHTGPQSTGHEIKGKVATIGEDFITFFQTPRIGDLVFQSNEKGEIWASLAYERWVQFPSDNWKEMQEANARLITAAPDLLDACKAALAKCPFPVGTVFVKKKLEDAISKAGETK